MWWNRILEQAENLMQKANPYIGLDDKSFWKKAVVSKTPELLDQIYKKKFTISKSEKIATAGSCFAQHVSRSLKSKGFNLIEKENSEYSANYGNIYTVAQLLQLAKESISGIPIKNIAWEKDGKYIDALRPGATSNPHETQEIVLKERLRHLNAVRFVLKELDIFIFTLGLTESWIRIEDDVVLPTAPGVIAGNFEASKYRLENYDYNAIMADFVEFVEIVKAFREGKDFKTILTVSPVPLTATASKEHILVANTYSKATLRAAATALSKNKNVDYFPSYEIVTNPRYNLKSYDTNLRTVKQSAVDNVMNYFFSEHQPINSAESFSSNQYDVQCEEQILEMYSELKKETRKDKTVEYYAEIVGDSHMNSLVKALGSSIGDQLREEYCIIDRRVLKKGIQPIKPITSKDIYDFTNEDNPRSPKFIKFATNAKEQVDKFKGSKRNRLILVGGFMGDGFLRLHGTFTERISPIICTISDSSEISKVYISRVLERINYVKNIIEMSLTVLNEENIRWVASPLPSESCAIERFGNSYVKSKSQVLYNKVFNDFINNMMGEYIDAGIIITQPMSTITEFGFSDDQYSFKQGSNDVHLNERYYAQLVPLIHMT